MDHIAKLEGSNEFFARRALYNCAAKLRRGDLFRARKHYAVAAACLRAGGLTENTISRISEIKNLVYPTVTIPA